jgi:signal recognition particle GTPase
MFTGRKDILERLAQFLDSSKPSITLKRQRVFVLYGLGGGGKTQIMAKFVIDFGDGYVHFRRCAFTPADIWYV